MRVGRNDLSARPAARRRFGFGRGREVSASTSTTGAGGDPDVKEAGFSTRLWTMIA
jgi:hypothetical protein